MKETSFCVNSSRELQRIKLYLQSMSKLWSYDAMSVKIYRSCLIYSIAHYENLIAREMRIQQPRCKHRNLFTCTKQSISLSSFLSCRVWQNLVPAITGGFTEAIANFDKEWASISLLANRYCRSDFLFFPDYFATKDNNFA